MNMEFTVTRVGKRFDLSGISRLAFLVVALLALSGMGVAQQKGIVTLLPIEASTVGSNCTPYTIDGRSTSPCKLVLKFQPNSLPPTGANFTAAKLMLAGQMKAAQTISVYANDNTTLAFTDLLTTQGQTFMAANPAVWSAPVRLNLKEIFSKPFSLTLQTQTPGAPSAWDDGSKPTGWGPRLVIEYNLPGLPVVTQTEGVPATQSPQPFMPSPDANQFTARNVSAISSYTPVSYKGLVYVINQNQLQALPAIGGPPLWSLTLSTEGQHLLLSESGRIYIVGKEKIVVYQLSSTPGNAATEVKTSGTLALSPKSVPNLNPSIAPAVGRDGSLYFANGIEVYGLNPDLQQLWKVTLADTATSRITVGPSGRFVYLLSRGEGLIAINAQTGQRVRITNADNSDTQSTLGKMTAFHVPVVIQHPDGTEKIYVAANSSGGGLLANFNNYYATVPQPDDPSTITEGWTALPGQWSQPIADQLSPGTVAQLNTAKKIYAVSVTGSQGTVNAIDWQGLSLPQTKTPTFPVGDSPDLLNPRSNGGSVAIDKNGKFLVWNGAETKTETKTETKLYVFDSGTSGSSFSLTGIKTNSQLLFGSDGTLYAPDPTGGTRNLRAILPQFNVSSSSAISSPTHLIVYGAVSQDTTLSAPGSVFLGAGGTGFTVKSGSTLRVQQPKQ